MIRICAVCGNLVAMDSDGQRVGIGWPFAERADQICSVCIEGSRHLVDLDLVHIRVHEARQRVVKMLQGARSQNQASQVH